MSFGKIQLIIGICFTSLYIVSYYATELLFIIIIYGGGAILDLVSFIINAGNKKGNKYEK